MDPEVRAMYVGRLIERKNRSSRAEADVSIAISEIATMYAGANSHITVAGVKAAIAQMDEYIRHARLTRTKLRRLLK